MNFFQECDLPEVLEIDIAKYLELKLIDEQSYNDKKCSQKLHRGVGENWTNMEQGSSLTMVICCSSKLFNWWIPIIFQLLKLTKIAFKRDILVF